MKQTNLRLTTKERVFLLKLANQAKPRDEDSRESLTNIMVRAIKLGLESQGVIVPDDLFRERKQGVRIESKALAEQEAEAGEV